MAEGQTATNPQTGERVVLRGGQWVPMGGAPRQQRQAAPRRQISFQSDADAVARTLIGEAANQGEQGMLAVGGVIANRARQRGLTPSQVVLERNQFEPWGNPETTNRLLNISPQSPEYQQAYAIAQRALAGEDPTGGASHFYAPRAQAALGRAKPSWDNGTGRAIGDHLFFNLDGSPAQTPDASFASAPMPAEQPAIQTATNPQTGEKLQLIDGQWMPMEQGPSQPPAMVPTNGVKDGVWVQATDGSDNWRYISKEQADREADPEYQAAIADARRGSANVPDQLRALGLGGTLGFLTDINATAQGALQGLENAGRNVTGQPIEYSAAMAAQAARDSERDAQARFAAENPLQNFALQTAGGFLTPGLAAGGNYIRGARLAEVAQPVAGQVGRAAQVGAAYGVASGIGYGQGNLIERAPDAAMGAIVGAGTGAIGQSAVDRLTRGAANATPSQARRLSRAGVNLTPAQMMTDVPVLGPVARWIEQAGSSIPIAGLAMRGAERRSVESFDRAVINDALSPIRATVPRNARGRDAIRFGDDALSARYQADLNPITILPDPQINARIMAALNPTNLSRNARTTLNDTAADIVSRIQSPISGPEWKQIDSELSSLINATANGDAASRPLSRALRNVRAVWGDALDQAAPGTLARVRETDEAFGNFQLIRKAASNPTTGRNDELFTPSNLNSVLARSEGRAYGRGEARLQNLVDPAEAVMAGTLNNSGTPERAAIATVALGGAATGAIVNPSVAIPTIVGVSALYSRPAQAALNAVYRATDSRAASEAVQELARLAQRNPALVPYYEGAVQHVLDLAQRDTPAAPQAQPSTQAPSAALQRVMQ